MATRASAAPEVAGIYARAGELARKAGRSAELFPTLWGARLVAMVAGDMTTAGKLVEELFFVARDLDDPGFLLQTHHAAFSQTKTVGDLAAAQRHAEAVLALYRPELHAEHALLYGAHDPESCARMGVALTLLLRGFPDQSRRQSEQALALARELPHLPSLAHVLLHAADCTTCAANRPPPPLSPQISCRWRCSTVRLSVRPMPRCCAAGRGSC